MFLPHPRVKVSIVGSLRDREVACSASDRQGSNFESCVWRTVSSQSSHHPQEVLLAQFSLYVHKGGLKPDSFHLSGGRRIGSFDRPRICDFESSSCQISNSNEHQEKKINTTSVLRALFVLFVAVYDNSPLNVFFFYNGSLTWCPGHFV